MRVTISLTTEEYALLRRLLRRLAERDHRLEVQHQALLVLGQLTPDKEPGLDRAASQMLVSARALRAEARSLEKTVASIMGKAQS